MASVNKKTIKKVRVKAKKIPKTSTSAKKKKAVKKKHPKKTKPPRTVQQFFAFALDNVSRYGDTDIFPFPVEKNVFFDKRVSALKVLNTIHKNFDNELLKMPPNHERLLCAVGYAGFRAGTLIDPIWNVYLLGLVLSIGDDIEKARIAKDKEIVFSYRFSPDPESLQLFDKDFGWMRFQEKSAILAKDYSHILTCDISDFYPRIYHHRLKNALKKATQNTEAIRRIKELLSFFSKGVSYGLPVGGPAARLLSELLLNRLDRLLVTYHICFLRFVDDYHIFANSQEEAYAHLVFLYDTLLENEGLTLQRNKTQVLSTAEYLSTSEFSPENTPESEEESEVRGFLAFHLHYDPYSETPDEDYDQLKQELTKFDIMGMLSTELHKSRIDPSLTKKLVKAIGYISSDVQDNAVRSMIESLYVLYPVFSTVMMVLRSIIDSLPDETQQEVYRKIRELIRNGSYLVLVPTHLAFAIRLIARDNSEETDDLLISVYKQTTSVMIKRDIILILASHNADYWISAQLKKFAGLTIWERRSLIIASYILEDEGKAWRKRIKNELSQVDKLLMDWAAEKKNSGTMETLL